MKLYPFIFSTLLCVVPLAVHAQVNVRYTDAQHFTDMGSSESERAQAQRQLTQHIEALAKQYMPAGQTLDIEITDVDLAGRQQVSFRRPQLRVVKSVDWPSINLRYVLKAGEQILQQQEVRLSDMGFDQRLRIASANAPLHDERRMLEEWFRTAFTMPGAQLK
jgi:hypothetical protein